MKILVTPDKVTPLHHQSSVISMWGILVILELHGNNVGTTDHELNRAAPPAILKTESWIALICDHIYMSGICDVVLTWQR